MLGTHAKRLAGGPGAFASPFFSVAGLVGLPAGLEQKPGPPFGIIDIHFQKACGRDILMVIRDFVGFPHGSGHGLIGRDQLAKHVQRSNEGRVVVLQALVTDAHIRPLGEGFRFPSTRPHKRGHS
jgi:hypothetical protein